ncbi:MAG: hypothetical protein ACI8QC_004057 [Planctomycetota bacterium]|jgi:hypothetical protein
MYGHCLENGGDWCGSVWSAMVFVVQFAELVTGMLPER